MKLSRVIVLLFVWLIALPANAGEWTRLKGCLLLPNESNDGDSFHVEHDGREYIFRLYFVDTPESSLQVETRVAEQATDFGVSEEKVLQGGKDAAKFTERVLHGSFTVITRFQNARGASNLPRSYAVVKTSDGKDLASMLVEAGLARAFGVTADVPGGNDMGHYKQLEARARRSRFGIFGGGRPSSFEAEDLEVAKSKAEPAPTLAEISVEMPSLDSVLKDAEAMAGSFVFSEPGVPPQRPPAPSVPKSAPASAPAASPGAVSRIAEASAGKLSLNHATKEELENLPGIGPVTASAIIAARPFSDVEDLLRVPGIGAKKFQAIEPFLSAD